MAKKTDRKTSAGYFIPAGMFIGLGLGMLFGNTGAGVIIGMGAGFLAFGIVDNLKK